MNKLYLYSVQVYAKMGIHIRVKRACACARMRALYARVHYRVGS